MFYKLPVLSYSYDSLEPFFDEETMKLHHLKHHQTYVNNLNRYIKYTNFLNLSIEDVVKNLDRIDVKYRDIIKNNSGGHINHSFFWKLLKVGTNISEELEKVINNQFGSIDDFKQEFEDKAMSRFGSGWIWLLLQDNHLVIDSTANQDNPLMGIRFSGTFGYPILALDLWEHSYYLKYRNKKLDYINAFWEVINWDVVLDLLKNITYIRF
ncbi:Fe-Mn family superoxide dismutase [Buchnera aphidicola]|uniref:Fe-Mn family superoxide dismutase n=1 Tax=Buchnera aphidicola TaxID=9 RepID=UPI003463F825